MDDNRPPVITDDSWTMIIAPFKPHLLALMCVPLQLWGNSNALQWGDGFWNFAVFGEIMTFLKENVTIKKTYKTQILLHLFRFAYANSVLSKLLLQFSFSFLVVFEVQFIMYYMLPKLNKKVTDPIFQLVCSSGLAGGGKKDDARGEKLDYILTKFY